MAKLLLVAPTCNGEDVGEAWVAHQWARRLGERHDVTLLTYHKRGATPAARQLSGIEVIEWMEPPLLGNTERLNSMLKPGYIPFYIRARRWIRTSLENGRRFDVVHQPVPVAMRYPSPAAGFGIPLIIGPVGGGLASPPGFSADEGSSPWFMSLRKADGLRRRWDPMLRRSFESADCVLGIASYVEELLAGIPLRRFEVMSETGLDQIPAPIDRRDRKGHVRLLHVGRLVRTKGARDVIRALGMIRDLPVTLDIVGDVTQDESESGPTTLLYVGQAANPGATNTGSATTGTSVPAYTIGGVRYGTATGSQFISYSPYGNYAQDTFSHSPYVSYENYLELAPRDGSATWAAPIKSAIDSWGVSGNLSVDLSPSLNLTSITAYRKFSGVYASADGSPLTPTLQASNIFNRQFSQELRLNGKVGSTFNFTVGGYYFHKRSENRTRVTLTTLNFIEDNVIPATTKAVFANADWELVPNLHAIGGIRYTDLEKTFIFGRKGIPGSSTGGATPASLASLDGLRGTYAGTRVDWRGVLQYRWSDQLMTYAQVSTGFKGGGVNPRPFFPSQALAFGPEKLIAYEGGFKSDLFSRMLRLNVSAFINKYDDILVSVTSCPQTGNAAPCALPLNAGKATVKGGEAELTLRPAHGFEIDASLAYLNFEYTSISASAASSGIGIEDDGQYISPWQWSAGAQYEIDLGSTGSLTTRIDINHQDAFNRNANNIDATTHARDIFGQVAGRTLVNAHVTYRTADQNWEVTAEARNLTDKLYYSDLFDNRGSTNSIQGSPGEPRTFAITLKRKF